LGLEDGLSDRALAKHAQCPGYDPSISGIRTRLFLIFKLPFYLQIQTKDKLTKIKTLQTGGVA
jgi:hypothetical protein